MGKIGLIQSVILPLSQLEVNKGQIEGLPKNPRFIRDERYNKLKRSIKENPEMLALRECLVFPHSGKYVVIGGNMRYQAQKELGYTEIVCKVIPPETPVEALRAYTIKDNSGFGEWDFDALANDWNAEDLLKWGIDIPNIDAEVSEDEEAQEDNFNVDDNLPKVAKTKIGDIYRIGKHRLICGDSIDTTVISALMGDRKADLLITDPPYNVNYSSKNELLNKSGKGNLVQTPIENDKMYDVAFQEFLYTAFTNANNVLKKGGAFYIFHADVQGYNFRTACLRTNWDVRQVLIWNKNNMVLGRQDYQWKHEPILYGWKEGAQHYFVKDRSQITVQEDKIDIEKMTKPELKSALKELLEGNIPTTVINEDKPVRNSEHPTMKPLKLLGRLIRNSSRPGEIVLDMFGGSGSTMMAAEQLNRICYMVELDACYCDVIVKRYEELTGQTAEFEGNIFVSDNSDTN
jgi:DNA modification methylase